MVGANTFEERGMIGGFPGNRRTDVMVRSNGPSVTEIWRLMAKVPRHTYHVLTKRAERLARLVPRLVATFGVLENLQLGVTVENQDYADKRIPRLLSVKAAWRFISYEPALGRIDIRRYLSRPALTNGWIDGLSG